MNALLPLAARGHAALPLDVLAGLTLLAVVPFLLVMCTSFVRIVVVLSLVRSAIGASALPPNAVLSGIALVLTLVVMAPTAQRIEREAVDPYSHGSLSQSQALERAQAPLRAFMLRQTHLADIGLFERVARRAPEPASQAPLEVLVPGVRRRRTAQRVRHRLRALSAVRRHRSSRRRAADGARHDDAQPAGRLASRKAAAVRDGRRLGAGLRRRRIQL